MAAAAAAAAAAVCVCGCFIAHDRGGMYCIGGNVRERVEGGREGETEADRREQTYTVASLQSAL